MFKAMIENELKIFHMKLVTLHSSLPKEMQQEAFVVSDKYVKIIIATNIAETSITIRIDIYIYFS